MKNILILMAVVSLMACGSAKFSQTGQKEKQKVSDFLACMDHASGPKYIEMMNCISPQYLKQHGIDRSAYKVDNYSIYGFSIESYTRDGMVTAKVWGEARKWVHKLTFKLTKSGGKIYIIPSEHSDKYISPWWSRETYIREVNPQN